MWHLKSENNYIVVKITCLTCANPVIRKSDGKISLSEDNDAKQAMDTIFELTYKEKVTDIFKDVIDYKELIEKKNEFTLSVNFGEE